MLRIVLMLPLRPTARAWHPSSRHIAVSSLPHNKRDIVDNVQPISVVIRKAIKVCSGPSCFSLGLTRLPLLLQVPLVSPVPPCKTYNHQERALGSAREDVRPLVQALRQVLFRATPFWLNPFPPFGHLRPKVGDRESITAGG